jgi:uncharacterized protein (TIGR02246 family)
MLATQRSIAVLISRPSLLESKIMKRPFSMIAGIAIVLALANLAKAGDPVKETPPTTSQSPAAQPAKELVPVKEPEPAKSQSPAERAVHKAASDFDQAFNSGDAEKVAGQWTTDAEYIDEDGQRYVGRDAIKKEYAEFFAANPHAKITSVTDSVRVINDTTAVEDGRAMIQPPPEGAPASSRYTAIYVLHDGKWLLSSVHDMKVTSPSNYHKLDDFEWLIGSWQAGEGDNRIETTCHWLKNKSFVERTYQVINDGLPASSGTQIIGWDPETQQLTSWNFSSDSGYAKDTWKPIANGWWSQSSGVLGDGTKTTAVKVFQKLDDDTLSLKSTDRTAGGVRLPDLKEVIFKRSVKKVGA